MKQILHIIFGLTLIALAQSCSPKLTNSITSTTEVRDSARVVVSLRDTTVTIPGDSLLFDIPLVYPEGDYCAMGDTCESPSQTLVYTANGERSKGKITVSRQRGVSRILAQFNCDEYRVQLQLKDSLIERYRSESKQLVEIKVVRERYVPAIYKWALGFSILVLCILMSFVAIKILKKTTIWGKLLSLASPFR